VASRMAFSSSGRPFAPSALQSRATPTPDSGTIFVQGSSSDAVFYIQKGKVKLTVVAKGGKEATIGILNEGDFLGEGCLTGQTLRPCGPQRQ
jgi:CRP-like cAMP-binding protein